MKPKPPGNVYPGDKFNRLTAIRFVGDSPSGNKIWLWLCDCGKEHQAIASTVKSGGTKSCGCLMREKIAERNHTHGLRNTPEYRAWASIKTRCNNPNSPPYQDYGGRGIRLCPEWENDVAAFYEHVGPRPTPKHSIERKNNNGHYEPGNVHWATKGEQSTNRRSSHFVKHNDEYITITELARRTGTTTTHIHRVMLAGYTVDEIVDIRNHGGTFKSKGVSLNPEDIFLSVEDVLNKTNNQGSERDRKKW